MGGSRDSSADFQKGRHLCSKATLFSRAPVVVGDPQQTEGDKNALREDNIFTFLCQKEELRFGNCLLNWLKCYYKWDCSREYILMKLICSEVGSNWSSLANDYTDCREGAGEASLLVSPLVVAGIVIGLVLFLSCVTITVGSLRKGSRLRNSHLRAREASDGLSYSGSIGELTSGCIEEFPPAFDFSSYAETPSHASVMYPDSPPQYEDCVRPGATEIYVPTDDPPPYSLTDLCLGDTHVVLEMEEQWEGSTWLTDSRMVAYLPEVPLATISISATPLEDVPSYEAVVNRRNQHLPLGPKYLLKHSSWDRSPQDINQLGHVGNT